MRRLQSLVVFANRVAWGVMESSHPVGALEIVLHRLQQTHEVEFVLGPETAGTVVRELCGRLLEELASRPPRPIRIKVWEFQPQVKKILEDLGFEELVERILVYYRPNPSEDPYLAPSVR